MLPVILISDDSLSTPHPLPLTEVTSGNTKVVGTYCHSLLSPQASTASGVVLRWVFDSEVATWQCFSNDYLGVSQEFYPAL